ncbi:aldose epimerase family protein [Sulfitobacter sp. D35]|uniref:aldose epimerase family protein n=1 Tax=Sulfitobacter sp. D35 TaxID=3083252 RepID=UPI00296F8C4B|nr:aldose epimerase family protein [Sulfitobacter sp. D35]MDW4498938.1 aldose epimerase family protein [Sulfitobacter sp. D35]
MAVADIDFQAVPPPPARFGETQAGDAVSFVQIRNGSVAANLMTWGASLQDLRHERLPHALVLGSPRFEPYLGKMRFFGAVVGRVANRIADGRATIDGQPLALDRNEDGRTMLHGGRTGTGTVNWTLEGSDETSCRFSLICRDGQDGFPGNLSLSVTYRLEADGTLVFEAEGRTDAPTFCNLAHHAYWKLDGRPDLSGHRMIVNATHYLPVDERQIPSGDPAPVEGTRFDFRGPRPVVGANDPLLDHNFCLVRSEGLRPACSLRTDLAQLDVETTEPGLQVYEGRLIDTAPAPGHGGTPYGARAGVAIEPQGWPDAPNRAEFPSVRLEPGDTYRQISRFRVSLPTS